MLSMKDRGHSIVAVAPEPENEWEDKFRSYGIKYLSIKLDRNGTNPISDIKSLIGLRKLLLNEKPDSIFIYQAKTIVYGCIAAKMAGIKNIYALLAGLGSIFRSKGKENFIVRSILTLQYKTALSFCKKVYFQNNDDIKLFKDKKLVHEGNYQLVNGSGVNLNKYPVQPLPENNTFLFVGRLLRDKGLIEFMEAAREVKNKYPNSRFVVVGPFDTNPTSIKQSDLRPYVEDSSIEYMGATDDVRPYLKECSIFVLPSYHEGTPRSVLEAMATGRAILTTDAPGCRETVSEGVNGFLVPVKESKALADKMLWMIENPSAVKNMALKSAEICKEKYDVKKVNKVILDSMSL
jgi:glycosyltransferase involved in cell wall biosynthesis